MFVQGVSEPFVLDADGCLDLTSMQIDPKVTILNGKRALLDSHGRTKRTLAQLRDLFGDPALGTILKPFKVAKGQPLQSFSPVEPASYASGSRSSTLLFPVYSLADKSEPTPVPSTSLPASRPPIQTPTLITAPSGTPATRTVPHNVRVFIKLTAHCGSPPTCLTLGRQAAPTWLIDLTVHAMLQEEALHSQAPQACMPMAGGACP